MRLRRLVASGRRRLAADDGISIVEIGVAMMVMTVAVMGVIGSLGSGLHLVGQSRQRSAATAVAQERLERIQNVPYARVALYEQPAHSADSSNPDNDVTTDGTTYQVDSSMQETLVVCPTLPASPPNPACVDSDGNAITGALKHIDDPVTLGTTEFNVFQYVTWHDDPAIAGTTQDYKRVIVLVTWKFPVQSGQSHRVIASSFISQKGVIVASAATPTPTAPATAAPTAGPTAPPQSTPCGTMTILSGTGAVQGFTNTTSVQIQLAGTEQCTPTAVDLSNDPSTGYTEVARTPPDTFPAIVTWSIPSGDGTKIVHARTHDAESSLGTTSGTITLDQTRPTTVTNLRVVSCNMTGTDRTISLTWDAAGDANLLGYRLYKSIESAAFTSLLTTTAPAATNTDSKSYSSLRYIVRAYDKAGNESLDSNVLSFSKNNC